MKKLIFAFLLAMLSWPLFAQEIEIIGIEIRKTPGDDYNNGMVIKLAIYPDMSAFSHLDEGTSRFTVIKDDTGFDMLAAQVAFEKTQEDQGFGYDKLSFRYSGMLNNSQRPGIRAECRSHAVPAKGAATVNLQGTIAVVNLLDKQQTFKLEAIPTSFTWGDPGVQTTMGMVKITESGSVSINDVDYTKYRLETSTPVASLIVKGGDDREEVNKSFQVGLEANEMIFKSIPQTLDLEVVAHDTETTEIPFNLELTIGL